MANPTPLNPGSSEALEWGCLCPVLDNAHGAGCGMTDGDNGITFWVSEECPLHGSRQDEPDSETPNKNWGLGNFQRHEGVR
jgi:hypothetical protein